MSNVSPFEQYQFRPGRYDWYRCDKCERLFSHNQERARIKRMAAVTDQQMYICCTSRKYRPAPRPVGREWLRPSILIYTVQVILARVVAPWAEVRSPKLLQIVSKLV